MNKLWFIISEFSYLVVIITFILSILAFISMLLIITGVLIIKIINWNLFLGVFFLVIVFSFIVVMSECWMGGRR